MSKITISNPRKVVEGNLAGVYVCEVYLPDIAKNNPIYADSSDDATKNANIFVEVYLKEKMRGIEDLLKEKDINKRLMEQLKWAKQQLAERQTKT